MRHWLSTTLGALALLLSTPVQAATSAQPPRDTCTRVAGYALLRTKLTQIVAERSKDRLLALLSPDILNSFGGDGGVAEFIAIWQLDQDPDQSKVWRELAAVLKLGCHADSEGLSLPWFFAAPPPRGFEDADAFTLHLVTGTGVALRAAPQADAPVIARLDWTVLNTIDEGGENARWRHVRLRDGRSGYFSAAYLRSQVDYRALFRRIDGRWMMTAFVAGD